MADLSFSENKTIETLFINEGFVLDFSDSRFRLFVGDATNIDINDKKYSEGNSGSKGNRLRKFIRLESEFNVGKLVEALTAHLIELDRKYKKTYSIDHYDAAHRLSERLIAGGVIVDIDMIKANNDDEDFHKLSNLIKEAIKNNQPETALDRLHTFLIKFLKELCKSHGVEFAKDETVNSLYGKYIKVIRDKKFLESKMAEKIVQFTFQVMDAFNDIRNNKSFAHDNPVLNYDESVLIFSNITSTVKFIQSMEVKYKNGAVAEAKPDWDSF